MRVSKRLRAGLLAAAAALVLAGLPAWAAGQGGRITVTGAGSVAVVPDMATITLGVTTEGKTAAAALSANSADLAKVMDGLTAAGIAARDIQTSGLSLNPRWQQGATSGDRQITGFVASNMVTVRVRALEGLGGALDALVGAGANTLNGLSFGLADPGPSTDAARRAAVADAIARAELYAKAAGVTLGRVVAIHETGQPGPRPLARMALAAEAVPVAAGELSVDASVTMVFAIDR